MNIEKSVVIVALNPILILRFTIILETTNTIIFHSIKYILYNPPTTNNNIYIDLILRLYNPTSIPNPRTMDNEIENDIPSTPSSQYQEESGCNSPTEKNYRKLS